MQFENSYESAISISEEDESLPCGQPWSPLWTSDEELPEITPPKKSIKREPRSTGDGQQVYLYPSRVAFQEVADFHDMEHCLLLEYHKIQHDQPPASWGLMHKSRVPGWHCRTPREMTEEAQQGLQAHFATKAMEWLERMLTSLEMAASGIVAAAEEGEGERCCHCTTKEVVDYRLGPDDNLVEEDEQEIALQVYPLPYQSLDE